MRAIHKHPSGSRLCKGSPKGGRTKRAIAAEVEVHADARDEDLGDVIAIAVVVPLPSAIMQSILTQLGTGRQPSSLASPPSERVDLRMGRGQWSK